MLCAQGRRGRIVVPHQCKTSKIQYPRTSAPSHRLQGSTQFSLPDGQGVWTTSPTNNDHPPAPVDGNSQPLQHRPQPVRSRDNKITPRLSCPRIAAAAGGKTPQSRATSTSVAKSASGLSGQMRTTSRSTPTFPLPESCAQDSAKHRWKSTVQKYRP